MLAWWIAEKTQQTVAAWARQAMLRLYRSIVGVYKHPWRVLSEVPQEFVTSNMTTSS